MTADQEVYAWAKRYAGQHTITRLAARSGYNRASLSLYLAGKYGADPGQIEAAIRPLMTAWTCHHLDIEILPDDCRHRRQRPRPQQAGSAMEEHWLACQTCQHNTGGKP